MENFRLTSQEGNTIPQIINWYGKMDIRKLNRKEYRELPRYLLLDMKQGMDNLYPDILTNPVFMVSREIMEVIRRYEEDIPFLYIALFNAENDESTSYYCPILDDDRKTSVIYQGGKGINNGCNIRNYEWNKRE